MGCLKMVWGSEISRWVEVRSKNEKVPQEGCIRSIVDILLLDVISFRRA